ncbi:MAG: DUF3048 C-terminal domain-containing protein, partial [Oscillospiraceae bacterium]
CTEFDLSKGEGYYFYGGKQIPIKWVKGAPESPVQLFDEKGEAIQVNVGKTYVAILGNDKLETLKVSATPVAPAEADADAPADVPADVPAQ